MKRISFVLTSETLGGGELFTIRLATAISKSVPVRIVGTSGSPVVVAAGSAGLDTTTLALGRKLGIRTVASNFLRFRSSRAALDRFFESNPDDLVVLQYKWEELLWAGRHNRGRVAVLEHGTVPPRLASVGWARRQIAKTFNRARSVVAVSPPARDSIIEISGRTPSMLSAGVDAELADDAIASRKRVRSGFGFEDDTSVIAFVSRVTRDKGIYEVIRTLARKTDLSLLVCGEGPDLSEAKELASDLGVDDRIHWLGWRDDAYEILGAADVLMLLSTSGGEGRPLVVLEALAVGTRTVAFESSPALVALADESDRILLASAGDEPALDQAVASALDLSREVVRLQTWDDSAASFLAEFDQSIPKNAPGEAVDWRNEIHQFGSVVVLSTADFDAPLWTNKQHVAVRLASEVPVLYIESLALRRPRLTLRDLSRATRRIRYLAGLTPSSKAVDTRVPDLMSVVAPAVIPLHEFRLVRWLNRRLVKLQVGSELSRLPGPILLWAYSPLAPEVLDLGDFDSTVFHCVDDLASVPGIPSKLISKFERELAISADLVVATSPPLYERLSGFNSRSTYFHNVVDVEHFARPGAQPPEPEDLANVPRPRALFVGALSDHKIDWQLLVAVATDRPDWSFVFIGPVGEEAPQVDMRAAQNLENVFFLGRRDYDDLPRYMWAGDIGLIPYRISKHTESIFPMKTLEYAAAGMKIISTRLPGVVVAKRDGLEVELVADSAEFVAGLSISDAMSNHGYLATHTWDSLLAQVFESMRSEAI